MGAGQNLAVLKLQRDPFHFRKLQTFRSKEKVTHSTMRCSLHLQRIRTLLLAWTQDSSRFFKEAPRLRARGASLKKSSYCSFGSYILRENRSFEFTIDIHIHHTLHRAKSKAAGRTHGTRCRRPLTARCCAGHP